MNIRLFFASLLLAAVPGILTAQDKIFKSDGSVIDGKILNVGPNSINYSRADNPNGPEYTILKNGVDKIKYQDGREVKFENKYDNGNAAGAVGASGETTLANNYPGKYRRNIVAFAPIQFTENGIAGLSFSYEHAIDHNSIVAFYMPAILTFNTNINDYNGNPVDRSDPMFYLMPGIKIYPTGGFGMAKYAIGPSLVFAAGQKTEVYYNALGGWSDVETRSRILFGMMVNQSININPTPRLYLGSEFGFGFTYLNQIGGTNRNIAGLVQFSFKIGYRI